MKNRDWNFNTIEVYCDQCHCETNFDGDVSYREINECLREEGWYIRNIDGEWMSFCCKECFDKYMEKQRIIEEKMFKLREKTSKIETKTIVCKDSDNDVLLKMYQSLLKMEQVLTQIISENSDCKELPNILKTTVTNKNVMSEYLKTRKLI